MIWKESVYNYILPVWKYTWEAFCFLTFYFVLGYSSIKNTGLSVQFSRSVMSASLRPHGLVAYQVSLSLTISQSLLKFMSIGLGMLSNHLILLSPPFSFCLQSFPESGSFPMSWLFTSRGQSIEASTLVSVLPMNIQGWFPLGLTDLISLLSKGLSRIFSCVAVLCRSVMSSSLQPHGPHQAPLSVEILQARILEWVAISSSRGSSQPRDRTLVSHIPGRCFNLWTTRGALV